MKKRQKPILLVTLLAVFITAAVAMNFAQNPPKQTEQQPEAQPEQKVLGQSRESKAADVTNSVAQKMSGNKAPAAPMAKPGGPEPSLLRPKPSSYRPKPSDSQTSAQWYSKEHAGAVGD
jgi:hypothetical protein